MDNIAVNWTLPVISGTPQAEAFSLSLQELGNDALQNLCEKGNKGEYWLAYIVHNDSKTHTISFLVNSYMFLGGAHGIGTSHAYVLSNKTASAV